MTLGTILVVAGTALGVGSIICIGLEAVRIERLGPSDPSDWSDADPRLAELLNERVFHFGTDSTGCRHDHGARG